MPNDKNNKSVNKDANTPSIPNQKIDLNQRLLAKITRANETKEENFKESNEKAILELINNGHINLKEQEICGTILVAAASRGYTKIVRTLVSKGIDVNYVDKVGNETALYIAAFNGYTETVEVLIELTAIIIPNIGGHTALSAAALYGHTRTVEALLNANNDEMPKEIDRALDILGKKLNNKDLTKGKTDLLLLAAGKGLTKIVIALVKSGIDVNSKDENGIKTLLIAAINGHTETVKALIELGATLNTDEQKKGAAALLAEAHKGHTKIVEALIASGIDVNSKNENGNTALLAAARNNNNPIETAETLINFKIDVNHRNKADQSALDLAASTGNNNLAKLLLENSAEINARNKYKETALHLAAKAGHHTTVQLLVQRGADITIKRDKTSLWGSKKTPLDLATDATTEPHNQEKIEEFDKIINLLKEKEKEKELEEKRRKEEKGEKGETGETTPLIPKTSLDESKLKKRITYSKA